MKYITVIHAMILVFLLGMLSCNNGTTADKALKPSLMLWYEKPAANWTEAHRLGNERFMSQPFGQFCYQPFGNINLQFPGHENVTNFKRILDLEASDKGSLSFDVGLDSLHSSYDVSLNGNVLNVRYRGQVISQETIAGKTYSFTAGDF